MRKEEACISFDDFTGAMSASLFKLLFSSDLYMPVLFGHEFPDHLVVG